ncbi:MAG: response regulator [Candidatus Omnitrophica bacterium]|nr:response regulator [Candidatus Omnitrophota bacterium]
MYKILFAHNDPSYLGIISTYLAWYGFSVEKAGSSADMFKKMGEERYDMLIVDTALRSAGGFAMARIIREGSGPAKRGIPILLVGMEEPDFERYELMEKNKVYFITAYRRSSIWVDKINSILSNKERGAE